MAIDSKAPEEKSNPDMRVHVTDVLKSILGLTALVTGLIFAENFGVWSAIGSSLGTAFGYLCSWAEVLWAVIMEVVEANRSAKVTQGLVSASILIGSVGVITCGYALLNPGKKWYAWIGAGAGQCSALLLMLAAIIAMSIRIQEGNVAGFFAGLAFCATLLAVCLTVSLAITRPMPYYNIVTAQLAIWSGCFTVIMLGSSDGVYLPGFGLLSVVLLGLAAGYFWLDEYKPSEPSEPNSE